MKIESQVSESRGLSILLALVGGFLETYTFLLHGHVFANAQTGNIALCGISLARGDWVEAFKYAIPVASFALGVLAVESIRRRWTLLTFHWRQLVVVLEAVLLCGCFFLCGETADRCANLVVSVVCALQVQAFRKVEGTSYASTMCTGNLRSVSIALLTYLGGQRDARGQVIAYVCVIASFFVGAALAVPAVRTLQERSVVLPISFLLVAGLAMIHRPRV